MLTNICLEGDAYFFIPLQERKEDGVVVEADEASAEAAAIVSLIAA